MEMLRFATAGSVDDGKSTLIGRLLLDSKQIFEDQLEAVERTSRDKGFDYTNLALLTDGLRAEREQGITIDVAYRYFATPKRKFIIADTPGHVQYTRNMVTGASTADLALVLVDARKGMTEQSRRHAVIASLLQVKHLAVCVNKMDLVEFDEKVFEEIRAEFTEFAGKLEFADLTFIPISALLGDNVIEHSPNTPWYGGPDAALAPREPLHRVGPQPHRPALPGAVRHPADVQRPSRLPGLRRPGGRRSVPRRRRGPRAAVRLHHDASPSVDQFGGPIEEASRRMSVTIRLADEIDISRGDMICRPHNAPTVSQDIDAMVCWFSEKPLRPRSTYAIKHTTRSARCMVRELSYRLDINTLHRDEDAGRLAMNDIGRVTLRTTAPLFFDEYRRNRHTGSFILIDEATNETVAGGMILGEASATSREHELAPGPISPGRRLAPDDHRPRGAVGGRHLGGVTVWFTGLSGSGKSTISNEVARLLVDGGRAVYLLDGDNLRFGLNGDLGFDRASREENVRRVGEVARLMADAGIAALVPVISPYREGRDRVREIHEAAGLRFVEVFVDTPIEECEQRDPKGLYAKARAGELQGLHRHRRPLRAAAAAGPGARHDDGRPAALAGQVVALLGT